MAITQTDLGQRLRAARDACRLTQEDVAQHLGLSRPAIVQIEAGNRSVSSLELAKLARLFGRDIGELIADELFDADANPLAALFRAQSDIASDPAVLDQVRRCMALARELTNLERLLGIDRESATAVSYELHAPRSRADAIRQAQRLAHDERQRLGLGITPLPDLAELLESQGVRTAAVHLPDTISGATLRSRETGLFVLFNERHAAVRRRFSLAHEYAHVIADHDRLGLVSRTVDRDDLLEVRANTFAANFLMPKEGVVQFIANLGKGMPSRLREELFDEAEAYDVEARPKPGTQSIQVYDVVLLAHHFQVSALAALYRLRNLGLVRLDDRGPRREAVARLGGHGPFELLKEQCERRSQSIARRLGLPPLDDASSVEPFRHRFLSLALEAYRRDEITRGKLRELARLVGMERGELDELVNEAGLDDTEEVSA